MKKYTYQLLQMLTTLIIIKNKKKKNNALNLRHFVDTIICLQYTQLGEYYYIVVIQQLPTFKFQNISTFNKIIGLRTYIFRKSTFFFLQNYNLL